jgi:integrase
MLDSQPIIEMTAFFAPLRGPPAREVHDEVPPEVRFWSRQNFSECHFSAALSCFMVTYSIRKRAGLFLFRTSVPSSLRNRFERKELIRSLPARTKAEARQVAQVLALRCRVVFMVALKNPKLGFDAITALMREQLDARSAAAEAAFCSLDGTKTPSLDDLTCPASLAGAARAAAHIIQQNLTKTNFDMFDENACRLLAEKHNYPNATQQDITLVGRAIAHAEIAHNNMLADQVSARFPNAPQFSDFEQKIEEYDFRIALIRARIPHGERYGNYLNDDQIRQFLASEKAVFDPDSIEEAAVRKFANQTVNVVNIPYETNEPNSALRSVLTASGAMPEDKRGPHSAAAIAHQPQIMDHHEKAVQALQPLKEQAVELPISSAWPMFQAAMEAENRWKPRVVEQSIATQRIIVSVLGDIKPSELQPAACERLKAVFLKLPNNYHKHPRWLEEASRNGLTGVATVHQSEMAAKTAAAPSTTIKTWNKHVTNLNAFYEWSWKAILNRTGKPPSLDLHIKIDNIPLRNRSDRERDEAIFSQSQVATIFSSKAFVSPERSTDGKIKYPSRYFGLLILAHTGMRREEVFQLKVKHLKRVVAGLPGEAEREIWYIDLKNDPELVLKTTAAKRYIPLHDTLLQLGIVEHLVAGRGPEMALFRDINEQAMCKGDAVGKWALQLYKLLGMPPRGNHRWRHTVITYLNRAQVQAGHIEELVGHTGIDRDDMRLERHYGARRSQQGNSERSTYDAGLEIADLKQVVNKLTYDFDFSRLPSWRTVPASESEVVAHADH